MKVYSAPMSIKPPVFPRPFNVETYHKNIDEYRAAVRQYCIDNGTGPLKGETVRFPVADGYATYFVLNGRTLIHDASGDGYHFPYVTKLKLADIKEEIARDKKMKALFKMK